MLATHQVLLVGEQGVILYTPAENGVDRSLSLSWDEHDFAGRLTGVLGSAPGKQPLLVLLNDSSHSYRKEENTTAAECRKSLETYFPRGEFAARGLLEVAPDHGKEGKFTATGAYLLVALPAHEKLGLLRQALTGVRVMGYGVLPVESTGLVTALTDKAFPTGKKSRWAILAGQHEMGGLRQVVTRDGILTLTRLTAVAENERHGNKWLENVAMEIKATMTYLARFGYQPEDGVDLTVIAGEAEAQMLQSRALPVTRLRCLTLAESLHLLGCNVLRRNSDGFADDLHAAWVEHRPALTLPIPMTGMAGMAA